MNIVVVNLTANQLSYLGGKVIIAPNSNSIVSSGVAPYLALDATFNSDLTASPPNVAVSDGVTVFDSEKSKSYLATWLAAGPPQNSNDPIAFTLAGMGFSVTADSVLNSSTETALLLLTNPANSGINLRAMFFYAAAESNQGTVTIRAYSNPTVTSNGTPLPISNNLVQDGSPSSSAQAFALPTISNNGVKRISLVSVAAGNTDLLNFAQTAILAPGNSLLLTVTVNNLGLLTSALTHFFMQWVEA